MRVDDGHERLLETGLHSRSWRLAVAQLLANALKNQYVRVNAHADGQDDASDAGKCQHSTKVGKRGKKNNQIEQERDHRVGSRNPVIEQHEEHDSDEAEYRRLDTVTNRIRAK